MGFPEGTREQSRAPDRKKILCVRVRDTQGLCWQVLNEPEIVPFPGWHKGKGPRECPLLGWHSVRNEIQDPFCPISQNEQIKDPGDPAEHTQKRREGETPNTIYTLGRKAWSSEALKWYCPGIGFA